MKQKRKKQGPQKSTAFIDLSKYQVLDEDDCFGRLHELSSNECTMCLMKEVCMAVCGNKAVKRDKIYLDELDWQAVPWDTFKDILKESDLNLDEVIKVTTEKSKCLDPRTVRIKVNEFIVANDYRIQDGFITVID